jgi:diguanylate cyclase (GGDEF)-like protein
MVTAVVAACAVLAACGLGLLAIRRSNARARRTEAVLLRIDDHLEAVSTSVARAVEAVVAAGTHRPPLALTLDFDDLLDTIVAETAARTGADAVVLRVEGPGARPTIAAFGVGVDAESLDRSFGPPGGRRFDVAVIDWTYSASGEPEDEPFQSALVTPLAATTGLPGTLAAYALARDAFGADHARAVRVLLGDVAVALSNARRFADIETRVNTDPVTGVLNRRGYDLELGREVARAERTGKPLSVVLVGVGTGSGTETSGIGEVARLVTGAIRRSDISCRRGDAELAILLPGTENTGAAVLTRRIEDEAKHKLTAARSKLTVGLVERRSAETPEAFDARIEQTVGRPRSSAVAALDDARNSSTAVESTVRSVMASAHDAAPSIPLHALRRDVLESIERELGEAREFGRSLALVALEVYGIDEITERHGRETADATLADVGGRLDRSLGSGSVHRLDATTFALVLPGSGVHEAEALVDALQTSLEPPHARGGVVLSAGITQISEGDDAAGGLERTEHALLQAQRAGAGTVVVAVPGKRPPPPAQ